MINNKAFSYLGTGAYNVISIDLQPEFNDSHIEEHSNYCIDAPHFVPAGSVFKTKDFFGIEEIIYKSSVHRCL